MKLLSLELTGYRQFAETLRIDLPGGLVGVCGPNGVGKSKLIESIGFALYGPNRRLLPSGDRARDLPAQGVKGAQPSVTLRMELRGQILRLIRTARTAVLEAEGGAILAETPRGVTRKVTQLLRLSPDAYLGTFVARQREVSRLFTMPASGRQRLVNRLIGISQVESAIEIAKEEKGKRNDAVTVAEARLLVSPETAAQLLQVREEALSGVQKAFGEVEAERDRRAEQSRNARLAVEQARSAGERLEGLTNQLTELDEHHSSLDREAKRVQEGLQHVMAAEDALREVTAIHISTEGAEAELGGFELLKERQSLTELLTALEADHEQRVDKLEKLNAVIEAKAELNEEIATKRQKLASTTSGRQDAIQRADAIAQRREKALNLGPDGICDVCGQRYGDTFGTAVAHLDAEALEFQRLADARLQEAASLNDQLARLELQITSLESDATELTTAVVGSADVPGRLTVCRADLVEIDRMLAPNPLAGHVYNETAHGRAQERATRRAQAGSEIERLRPLATGRADAEEALLGLTNGLGELEVRRKSLTSAIRKATEENSEFDKAKVFFEAAEEEHHQAINAVTAAASRLSEQMILRDQAARELNQSKERATALTAARRNLLVAERTTDVLVRLLTEITDEARPRLAELMDTWSRSLLGSRFKKVDLAEDYGIIADNGSGPHDLSHFSGGEQTVLSVMLRVAISLFCRERAGFDTGFLILDEIFGDQDAERRVLLVEFLSEIQSHYHQVFVVNHVDDVTGMLDSIIDVMPTGPNTSTAVLRS